MQGYFLVAIAAPFILAFALGWLVEWGLIRHLYKPPAGHAAGHLGPVAGHAAGVPLDLRRQGSESRHCPTG
ncbi:MAG: hypothetical protein LKM38_08235 [Pseudomonas veronii]|jgi:hypothetical protein|nr:hypothetical protein [Pseudomonas veronii]